MILLQLYNIIKDKRKKILKFLLFNNMILYKYYHYIYIIYKLYKCLNNTLTSVNESYCIINNFNNTS